MSSTVGTDAGLPTALAEAVGLPFGARWVRVALQVNPYGYSGANSPSQTFPDEDAYNAALVAQFHALDIEMIAVTDHWSVDSAQGLLAACTSAGIHALPGFEANTSEGVHLLVLFPSGTPAGQINAAIGACGVTPGCESGTVGAPFDEMIAEMTARGALVIPPHVNIPSGLFGRASGQSLAAHWRQDDLHAVGISPGQPVEPAWQSILNNKAGEFNRQHPVAVLYADDVCHPDRLAQPGATSWIKMSAPSLASLQVAVRTPETRIRTTDPEQVTHARVKAIAWDGGFLDGVRVHLNDSLNAVIGGRGTGKSTLVESIRYALDLPPIGDKARADHASFVQKVLQSATKVSVLLEVRQPTAQRFIVERTVPHPPTVRDVAGTLLSRTPLEVLGPIEIFSQHELAELAEDKTYVAELLQRFVGIDDDEERRDRLGVELAENRSEQLKISKDLEDLAVRLEALPRLQEQLKQFKDAGLDSRLTEQEQLQSEERMLDAALRRVEAVLPELQPLRETQLLDSSFANEAARADLPHGEDLAAIEVILSKLRQDLDSQIAAIENSQGEAQSSLAELRATWVETTTATREQYDAVVRDLTSKGLDAARYLAVTRRVSDLEEEVPGRISMEEALVALREQRRGLLAERIELDGRARRRLGEAAKAANDLVKGYVIVKPVPSRKREPLEALITRGVPGQRTQIMAAMQAEDFSPQAFAAACRTDAESLANSFGIRGAQAEALLRAGEKLYLEIEEYVIGLAAEAQLNVATTGSRYRNLDDLSKGQKATALLLLLLTSAASPLIIDQPEDNLDNRFIFDGIVRRLRGLKDSRQVILSTHNANVPVLGDAELVVALESEGDRGRITDGGLGSIDDETVRELAGEILEGGREAFDARRYLYGY